ncbi:hypothetical protein DXG03_005617 [Asterophora parasitica]|uniref:Glycosyltransferase 61 catalytic domain-containing protein n=1 Tax=Asterophora parasitica TaxID=117018 RepID=A0A9P7KBD7_9AGAR|nr:hypothetical protein DXG03_005617 [Asterophora parasitica]
MVFRHTLTRKDALLVFMGATIMHIWSVLSSPKAVLDQSILIDTQYHNVNVQPPVDLTVRPPKHVAKVFTLVATEIEAQHETTTVVLEAEPAYAGTGHISLYAPPHIGLSDELPHTSIIAHAPGWTIFRNLYMSNGTLFILSNNRSFPEIRMMTSTGLTAFNTPENIAAREPTAQNMDFITPEQARERWGGDTKRGERHRVLSVEGNTLLFNDPRQFLRHYYHFVAELMFGAWAFWHGAFSAPTTAPAAAFAFEHPAPPPIHRAIFAHSNADGWRDDPGFNAYFLRAVFPSLTVEVQEDWDDRVGATKPSQNFNHKEKKGEDRAWHFPLVLLADRSAAHRGPICGSQTQRTASEAWEAMRSANQLMGYRVGGWWEPLRKAVWDFAGVPSRHTPASVAEGDAGELASLVLPMPDRVVITYISRQGSPRRKLKGGDHKGLVKALEALVKAKGDGWELAVIQAERLTKDEQVRAAERSTILLGVHGNGLTHLVFMKPTRASAVIELFYPGGFAHDYHWTARALGMDHYAVWDDKSYTHPDEPRVNYPDPGFQGNDIPVNGLAVARLIEDHVERKRTGAPM